MTAFITDDRYDGRFLEIRKEIFGDNFPASAMINVRALAQPELLIEDSGRRRLRMTVTALRERYGFLNAARRGHFSVTAIMSTSYSMPGQAS